MRTKVVLCRTMKVSFLRRDKGKKQLNLRRRILRHLL